jgi:hypothetical protein
MSNGSEKRTPIRSGGDGARLPVAIGGEEGGKEWSRDLKAEREEYEAAVRDLQFELARAKRGFFSRLGHTVESGLAAAVNWMADGISSPANAPGPDDKTYERTSYLDTAVGAAGGAVFGKVVAKVASKVWNALGREAADTAATTGFKKADEVVDEAVDEVDHAGAGGGEPVPDPRQVEIAEEFASRAHHGDVPEPRDHGDVPHGAENLDEPGRIDELDPGLDPTWDPEGPWKLPAQRKGEWAGKRGESDWTPHDPGAYGLERGAKIPFREGVPDFSQWAVQTPSGEKALLAVPGLSGKKGDTALVIKQLAKQEGMTEAAVERWLADNDLVIHHFGGDEVQIVPERLHGALHHQGGASELRGRTPARIIIPLSAGHEDDAPPPPPGAPPPLPAQRLAAVLSKLGIDLPIPQRTASDDSDDGTEAQPAMTDPPPAVPAREAPPTLPPPQPPGGVQMSYLDDDRESEMSYREGEEGDEQSSRRDDGEGEEQTGPPRDEREDEERGEEQVSYPDDGKREAQAEEEVSYPDDGEREAQAEEQVSYPDDGATQAEEQVSYAEDGGGQGDGYDGGAVAAAGP